MSTLFELKKARAAAPLAAFPTQPVYSASLQAITQAQRTRHVNQVMQYFAPALTTPMAELILQNAKTKP
jgi:hypothetical protein